MYRVKLVVCDQPLKPRFVPFPNVDIKYGDNQMALQTNSKKGVNKERYVEALG